MELLGIIVYWYGLLFGASIYSFNRYYNGLTVSRSLLVVIAMLLVQIAAASLTLLGMFTQGS